jgi:hypothetical protein
MKSTDKTERIEREHDRRDESLKTRPWAQQRKGFAF